MKRLSLIVFTAMLLTVSAVGGRSIHVPRNQHLAIQITTNTSDKTLSFTVALPTDKRKPVATVPVNGGSEISGVRIAPVMEGDKVKFDVYLVSGDLRRVTTCDEIKRLPAKLLESHLAGKGQEITVDGSAWLVKVKIGDRYISAVPQDPIEEDARCNSCGSAHCGSLTCTPCWGKCMWCGDCGSVCCGV